MHREGNAGQKNGVSDKNWGSAVKKRDTWYCKK